MATHEELLASWNDTATRQAIVDFVDTVTEEGGDGFIPPEERIATFDNDGTLWAEKPIPIQLDFTLRRFAEMAEADPAASRPAAVQVVVRARLRLARLRRWSSTTRATTATCDLLLGAVPRGVRRT